MFAQEALEHERPLQPPHSLGINFMAKGRANVSLEIVWLLVCLFFSKPRMGFDLDLSVGRRKGTGTSLLRSKLRTRAN